MKVRLLAVMAVVVVGVMAGTSPAMAQKAKTGSSKSQWTKQHKDNVAFGGAIHSLRKQVDLTNGALGTITAASIVALTQLKDGLTAVADATTEFKYGVVQVATITGNPATGDSIAGIGPTGFFVTPPIYLTGAQSQVTFPIQATGAATRLYTAVRSVYPDKGAVECRVTINGQTLAATVGGTQSASPAATGLTAAVAATPVTKQTVSNGSGGFFHKMPQSRIKPENGASSFPLALVATEDNAVDLASSGLLNAGTTFTATTNATATLSCLRTS